MSDKRKDPGREIHGASDIAHPGDDEKWELQTAFFTAFVFGMWERVEGRDKKAAREARAELQTILLNSLGQSLRVALDDNDSIAKQWACKLLADVFVSVGKNVGKVRIKEPYGKLMEIEVFRDEKKRIGKVRTDVLFPGLVCAIAQRELKKAERYRDTLGRLKVGCVSERKQKCLAKEGKKRLDLLRSAGQRDPKLPISFEARTWKQAAQDQGIPEAYWPTLKLPDFSEKSESLWFEFLWPLISTMIDTEELDSRYELARQRYAKDSQKTAHDHLKTLARLRDKGAFYF
jgi:hypothetical protein